MDQFVVVGGRDLVKPETLICQVSSWVGEWICEPSMSQMGQSLHKCDARVTSAYPSIVLLEIVLQHYFLNTRHSFDGSVR